MLLKEFERVVPIEIWRDGPFSTLGFLSDPQPGMLVFIEDNKYLETLDRTPGVSCVITTDELGRKLEHIAGLAVSARPRIAFFSIHNYLACNSQFYWTDFPTEIDKTAKIHPRAYVAERNVRIGPNTFVEPNVTISERCVIGAEVVIRAGVVLGSVGFQTIKSDKGVIDMIHAGGIQILNNVDVLSNAVIANAVFRQFTEIGQETRIGNLAFVSHNVQIGSGCFIGHGCVINGNVKIGSNVWIGPNATLANNIKIGDGAKVSLGSTVIGEVFPGHRVTSNIAIDHKRFLRHVASLKKRELG